MADKSCGWESFKVEGTNVLEKIKEWIREGNVRRVIVEHDGRPIIEFPLTAGVVGAVLAPIAAAIGAVTALAKDCTIRVERSEVAKDRPHEPADATTHGVA